MRKILFALVVSLSGAALADTSTGDKKGNKGKIGDSCEADSDCDQGKRPLRCRGNKCEAQPIRPPVT